jgi:hypothetical protein
MTINQTAWDESAMELGAEELAMLAKVRAEFPEHFPENIHAADAIRWGIHYTWTRDYADMGVSDIWVTTWVGESFFGTKEECEAAIDSATPRLNAGTAGVYSMVPVSYVRAEF